MTHNQLIANAIKVKRIAPQASKKALNRRFTPAYKFDILEGVSIYDPRYKIFMIELERSIRESGLGDQVSRDSGFFSKCPVFGDTSILKTMPNTIRLPLNFGRQRVEKTMSSDDKVALKILVEFLCSGESTKPGRIVRDSSSGMPFFSTDLAFKMKQLDIAHKNRNDLFEALDKDDYRYLFYGYGLNFCSTTQIRLQVDKYLKPRPIIDFSTQYGGGKSEYREIEMYDETFQKMRTRVVCAMPGLANNIMSACFERIKDNMYSKCPFTLKHRGIEDIEEKLDGQPFIIGVDIKSFDSVAPANVIIEIINLMPFTDIGRKMVTNLLLGPWYCSDADLEHNAMCTEDVIHPSFETWKGMPSGIFFTTVINCIQVAFYKFVEYRRFYHWKPEDIIKFVKGELEVKSLILSDDGIDIIRDKSVYDEIVNKGFENYYVQFEIEDGVSFMGLQFYRTEDNKIKGCHNLTTYLTKRWQPERDVNSHFRKLPYQGQLQRMSIFEDNANFHKLREIELKVFRDIWKVDLALEEVRLANKERIIKGMDIMNNYSDLDRLVLAKPELVHYAVDESDLSEEVVDAIIQRIDQNICDDFASILIS